MEKVAQWGTSYFVLLPKYYKTDQIKKNEVGGTCGTRGRGEKSVQGFSGKARRKETTGKTKALMRGWEQNGSQEDWLGM
jgi:hypothetical protein